MQVPGPGWIQRSHARGGGAECTQRADIILIVTGECVPRALIPGAGRIDPCVGVGACGAGGAPLCAGGGSQLFEAVSGGSIEVGTDGVGEDVDGSIHDCVSGRAEDAA